eukprot:1195269-Prorocentrum_minimum.AAC.3
MLVNVSPSPTAAHINPIITAEVCGRTCSPAQAVGVRSCYNLNPSRETISLGAKGTPTGPLAQESKRVASSSDSSRGNRDELGRGEYGRCAVIL